MLGTSCPAAPPIVVPIAGEAAGEKKEDRLIELDTLLTTNGTKDSAGFRAGCTEKFACNSAGDRNSSCVANHG